MGLRTWIGRRLRVAADALLTDIADSQTLAPQPLDPAEQWIALMSELAPALLTDDDRSAGDTGRLAAHGPALSPLSPAVAGGPAGQIRRPPHFQDRRHSGGPAIATETVRWWRRLRRITIGPLVRRLPGDVERSAPSGPEAAPRAAGTRIGESTSSHVPPAASLPRSFGGHGSSGGVSQVPASTPSPGVRRRPTEDPWSADRPERPPAPGAPVRIRPPATAPPVVATRQIRTLTATRPGAGGPQRGVPALAPRASTVEPSRTPVAARQPTPGPTERHRRSTSPARVVIPSWTPRSKPRSNQRLVTPATPTASDVPDAARITFPPERRQHHVGDAVPVFGEATREPVWPSLPPSILADPAASDALPVRVDPVRPTRTGFSDRWRAEQGR